MRNDILNNINELIASRSGLLLATLNQQTIPELSATPFIKRENCFYIFISELAAHTQNLKQRSNISVMLIEDEQDAGNPFARKRLSYQCLARLVEREEQIWPEVLDSFEQRHGKTVSLLKSLPDFHLFELKALSGQYIEGFGKAFRLSGEHLDELEQQTK